MERKNLLFAVVLIIIFNLSFLSAERFGYNILDQPTSQNITNIFNNISINGTDLNLNNLSDVQVPSPSDGQSLVWDNSLMKWVAEFVISRWNVDLSNGYLYNNSDTLFFNESKLNNTIDARAASVETDFHIFINGSSYNNINHNITAGDADDVEFTIIPGNKFIFGDTFT